MPMRCRPPCLGTAGPIDIIQDLGRRGSLFITRPPIMQHVAKRADLEWTARALFKAIVSGYKPLFGRIPTELTCASLSDDL